MQDTILFGEGITKGKLVNSIRHRYLDASSVLRNFINVKPLLIRDVQEEPNYYARCFKGEDINVDLMFQLFERKFVNKPKIEEVAAKELDAASLRFLDTLQFHYDGVELSVVFQEGYSGDILLRRPRGIVLEFRCVSLGEGSSIQLTNTYEIYAAETFVLSFTVGDSKLALVPEEASGTKGLCSVNAYELKDRAIRMADVSYMEQLGDILKLVRG